MNYDNTNRGVLFRNEKRETDKHPEYTGKIDVDGTEYRLAAWVRESKAGKKFFSLAVSAEKASDRTTQKASDEPFNDDIPF